MWPSSATIEPVEWVRLALAVTGVLLGAYLARDARCDRTVTAAHGWNGLRRMLAEFGVASEDNRLLAQMAFLVWAASGFWMPPTPVTNPQTVAGWCALLASLAVQSLMIRSSWLSYRVRRRVRDYPPRPRPGRRWMDR